MTKPKPKRCLAKESGGVRCELPEGHEGDHACPDALAAYLKREAIPWLHMDFSR